MTRLPINTFSPLKTEDAVLRLARYMKQLKPRDVYSPELCLSFIYTKPLKIFFCRLVVKENIYSGTNLRKVRTELSLYETSDKKTVRAVLDKSSLNNSSKHTTGVHSDSRDISKSKPKDSNSYSPSKKSKKDNKSSKQKNKLKRIKDVESRFYARRIIFETPKYSKYSNSAKKTPKIDDNTRSIQHEDVFCIASGSFEKAQQSYAQTKEKFSDNSNHTTLNLSFRRDVSLSELIFRDGTIEYIFNNSIYNFSDPKIYPVSKFILRNIHLTISVRLTVRQVNNVIERTITFENNSQLDDILTIIRIELSKSRSSEHFCSDKYKEAIIDLPWNNVKFYEGGMLLTHPNASRYSKRQPFYFRHPSIHSRYNDFKEYMELNIEKLRVSVIDGQIKSLINFQNFEKYFPHFTQSTCLKEGEIINLGPRFSVNESYNVDYFRKYKDLKKSPFLTYLSKVHLPEYQISYLLEAAVHESTDLSKDEFGFLFTIYDKNGYIILFYENEVDLSRSSIIFVVRKRHYTSAINSIARFLSSDETNKREKLARGIITINNSAIRSIVRLSHTNYNQWRNRVYQITLNGV